MEIEGIETYKEKWKTYDDEKDNYFYKNLPLYENEESNLLKERLCRDDVKLVNVGIMSDCEGGMCFEYMKGDSKYRLILGYTELGEWIEFDQEELESIKEEPKLEDLI